MIMLGKYQIKTALTQIILVRRRAVITLSA
jgi:hypothetical protein